MNKDQMEGKFKQAAGSMKTQWGKLTDDEVKAAGGQKDKLVGKIQEKYGISKEEAERKYEEFRRSAA
jgi:uncharacterized protein YjbJ (UPF0337 family)